MALRCLVLAMLLMFVPMVFAGGFQTPLQGVKQTAMGGTGVANPLDASSIFFNPGALSFTRTNSLNLNAFIYLPKAQFREQGTNKIYSMASGTRFPFAAYWSWNTNPAQQKWKIGLGVYTPYANRADWDSTWAGRYVVNSTKLNTINIQPTFSYNIGNRVGVGAGFVYSRAMYDFSRVLPITLSTNSEAQMSLSSKAGGYGFNAGILVHITPKLDIGATYRSSVKYKSPKGSVAFTVPDALVDSFPNTDISTTIQTPWSIDAGITYRPEPKLAISFDVNYVAWKALQKLDIDFAQNTTLLSDLSVPRSLNNGLTFRLGGSYDIDSAFTIRFGTSLDLNTVPNGSVNPQLPGGDRFGVTLGGTMHSGDKFELDVCFTYQETVRRNELQEENYANLGGTYKGRALTIGLALNFNVGKRQKPAPTENPTTP